VRIIDLRSIRELGLKRHQTSLHFGLSHFVILGATRSVKEAHFPNWCGGVKNKRVGGENKKQGKARQGNGCYKLLTIVAGFSILAPVLGWRYYGSRAFNVVGNPETILRIW
jgi:hypothetical protein